MMVALQKRREPLSPRTLFLLNIGLIFTGSAIVAIAYNLFLLPNRIASGGVSGFATIIYDVFAILPAITLWSLNIPLFLLGLLLLGGLKYGAKTIIGTLFLPFVVYLTQDWSPATTDPLLGAIFGGIGVGLGLGLVFRAHASTGGTDLAAQIINKYTGASLGACVFVMDGLIVLTSAFVFSLEYALYALISLFITGKTIDLVQTGLGYAKIALVISEKEEQVRSAILYEIDRGVTRLDAQGGYTDKKRPVLMCVVDRHEVTKLKQVVEHVDPAAFVIVTNATEVLGEGFKT
ncbi:YitT family protein [Salsuginibacillus kocurii]|uniref:YitT family protein n=1 Tax=Salsuginibacillus kocurii TaxID=427078 RepID=UPI00037398C0|nr:YitT family protein [Salsuginibacillus kocurii]